MIRLNPKTVLWFLVAVLASIIAWFSWRAFPAKSIVESPAVAANPKAFPSVDIEAKSAYVYDAATGKTLYEKDPELQWPLASLTKLMSALTAKELVPDYTLVRITPSDLREEGDTGLLIGEEWRISKLLDYTLVVSSNDGIKAIASVAGSEIERTATGTPATSPEEAFVRRMNENAKRLGLTETYFLNQSGLDVSKTLSGGYGSAKDIAKLLEYILRKGPHILEATTYEKVKISSNDEAHTGTNTNKAIPEIPNLIASKTGYTDLSGGNVIVAWNAGINHPIIVSVLGSSYDGRFTDLGALVKATLEYLSNDATSTTQVAK